MISKISSSTDYDAYYELPDATYENKGINTDDFDQGEYVLEKRNTKELGKANSSNPEERKPSHKPTTTGVYDDLYDYGTGPKTSEINSSKTLVIDKYGCSKQRKFFFGSIVGIVVTGVIAFGVIYFFHDW